MEYLDCYDENETFLGKELYHVAHQKGLWHKTVHCWLYDDEGNVYFQIRADEKKMYTTASGHVDAGETLEEAFGREIYEEIGLQIEYNKSKQIDRVVWKMDKQKADGSMLRDRAFASVYVYNISSDILAFKFDFTEVDGLIKVSAKQALSILTREEGSTNAVFITNKEDAVVEENRTISFSDFLINAHETGLGKYGHVLNSIIELVNKENREVCNS